MHSIPKCGFLTLSDHLESVYMLKMSKFGKSDALKFVISNFGLGSFNYPQMNTELYI